MELGVQISEVGCKFQSLLCGKVFPHIKIKKCLVIRGSVCLIFSDLSTTVKSASCVQ